MQVGITPQELAGMFLCARNARRCYDCDERCGGNIFQKNLSLIKKVDFRQPTARIVREFIVE